MGKVITALSMSLDGCIAGPNNEVDQLFQWYFSGDTPFSYPGMDTVFNVDRASVALMQEASRTTGAIVYGRRTFDVAGAWNGDPPLGVPCFILTHAAPTEWVYPRSPFTFVTDGIASAIAQGQAVAGEKTIAIGSATTTQQCLQAGLLDELHIDLVPILIGAGVRLFDDLGNEPIKLERTQVIEGTGVTHLRFRMVKEQ